MARTIRDPNGPRRFRDMDGDGHLFVTSRKDGFIFDMHEKGSKETHNRTIAACIALDPAATIRLTNWLTERLRALDLID